MELILALLTYLNKHFGECITLEVFVNEKNETEEDTELTDKIDKAIQYMLKHKLVEVDTDFLNSFDVTVKHIPFADTKVETPSHTYNPDYIVKYGITVAGRTFLKENK